MSRLGEFDERGSGEQAAAGLSGEPQVVASIPGLEDLVEIGRGGFGVVYRARQAELNRVVAVKLMSDTLDAAGRERFAREGFVMGTVTGHPNIVQVLSVGTTSAGHPYILMPYLDGGSLADRLPVPWPEAVGYAVMLCGALETAHAAGVLHRDIKPANVLISPYGEPLLADFGISRIAGAFETSVGAITASIPFAPPEVLDGEAASVAGDVYSLGATLFCLLAGSPPFTPLPGEQLFPVILRITRDPIPDLRAEGVPAPVCDVVEAALAKNAADRPRSAADLGRALQRTQQLLGLKETELRIPGGRPAGEDPPAVVGAGPATHPTTTTEALAATPVAPTRPAAEITHLGDVGVESPEGSLRHRALVGLVAAASMLILGSIAWVVFGGDSGTPSAEPGSPTEQGAPDSPDVDPFDLEDPIALVIDDDGSLLVADTARHKILRVDTAGVAVTFAGTGATGDGGDGGPAVDASLDNPSALALGPDGEVFVASGGRIRRIDNDGIIMPVDGLDEFTVIRGLAVDGGSLYVASRTDLMVLTPGATSFSTLVGASTGRAFGDIEDIAIHPDGGVAVSDSGTGTVVQVLADGTVVPLAGSGSDGDNGDDRLAVETKLEAPAGIAFAPSGELYISEAGMNRVRRLRQDGTLVTVAGDREGYSEGNDGDGGPATSATFALGVGPLAVGADGTLYIADVLNHRIRTVDADGVVHAFG